MDAALIVINLEVIQLALQVELVPKEYVVNSRRIVPISLLINGCDSGT